MNAGRATRGSNYIEWAKTQSQARFNLATSGVINYPLAELPVKLEDLEISGPSWYGYEPLQLALAAKCGVTPDSVVAAIGTSLANHLAMAVVVGPGDQVLIEQPAYEPLVSLANYLGAEVRRFERRFEDGFRIDPDWVEAALTDRTRLIVLTNLHNPSGVLASQEELARIGEIARRVGARVLVDEVYLEATLERALPYAFRLGPEFISTSSLTKAYGLSGLRCGWVLAEPELARRMWRLNDLFGVIPAHTAEQLSVVALANLDRISNRARVLLERNRALLKDFFGSRTDLDVVLPEHGTIALPRLKAGQVDSFCASLRERYDVTVVPGRFFDAPECFRIGIGCSTEMLAGGLERLSAALDELA